MTKVKKFGVIIANLNERPIFYIYFNLSLALKFYVINIRTSLRQAAKTNTGAGWSSTINRCRTR